MALRRTSDEPPEPQREAEIEVNVDPNLPCPLLSLPDPRASVGKVGLIKLSCDLGSMKIVFVSQDGNTSRHKLRKYDPVSTVTTANP